MLTYTEPDGPTLVALDVTGHRTTIPPELMEPPRYGRSRPWAMCWTVDGGAKWIGIARTEALAERAARRLYGDMWAATRKMSPRVRREFEALLGLG